MRTLITERDDRHRRRLDRRRRPDRRRDDRRGSGPTSRDRRRHRRRDDRRRRPLADPGAIDVHTHMELPFGGTFAKDTFETRDAGGGLRRARRRSSTSPSRAAASSLREGLDAWHAKAEGNAVADYGFHMIMSDVNDDTLAEMDTLVDGGRPGLQAVHGLPGRLLQRRRGDLPGDAADREERRPDHDARRERDGDRRRRGRRGRRRPHRPLLPRRRPLPDLRGRGDEPGDPPGRGRRRPGLHRPPVGARGARRGPRRARPRARRRSPRPARSTCSCRSTT